MIRKMADMRLQERPNICGGDGVIHARHLVEASESAGKASMCSVMTIDPGCSIGPRAGGSRPASTWSVSRETGSSGW